MFHEANKTYLCDFASINLGFPLRVAAETLPLGDIALLQLKNVSLYNEINWDEVTRIELPVKKEPVWLNHRDIVFSARGTKTLAYPLKNVPSRAVSAPQFFVISLKKKAEVLPEFLAWQINQRPAQDYFQRNATGSTILNIRRAVLENLPVTMPPVHEQKIIVELWRTSQQERTLFERLIENRKQQMDALATWLYQSAKGTDQ